MSKTVVYNLLIITDKGNVACQHVSAFGFDKELLFETLQEKMPDRKIKEVRILSSEKAGKSTLLQRLLKRH